MGVFILNGYNSWESADEATSVVRNRLTSAHPTGQVSSSLKVFIASTGSTGTPIVVAYRWLRLSLGSAVRDVRDEWRYSIICEGPRYYGVIGERTGTFAILRVSYKILPRTFLPVNNTKYVLYLIVIAYLLMIASSLSYYPKLVSTKKFLYADVK